MLDSISKFGGATEKFNNLTGVLNAAKSAVLNNHDDICEEPAKAEFKFTRPAARKAVKHDEVKVAETAKDDAPDLNTCTDEILFDEDITDQPLFKSERVKDDLLVEWEIQGVDGPDIAADEEMDATNPHIPPLLLGFDTQNYFVELEYMVVADPETGESIAPDVSVKASEDNKSGEIYLNGKLVACVEGAQDLLAQDVVLIKVES